MDLLRTFKNNHVLRLCPCLLEGGRPVVVKWAQTLKSMNARFSMADRSAHIYTYLEKW